ncbi:MAG: GAF domain-containing protein, partial [Thiomonas delicata]
DAFGQLQIEASQGAAGQRYHHAMMSGQVPKISINPEIVAGQGPGGRAWRSGDIVVSDAWAIESRNKPWQQFGIELRFRSSAAVPLLDQAGKSMALLSLYSAWPGFFSTLRVRNFIRHVQRVLSYAIEPLNEVPILALRQSQAYRRLLAEQRVTILYQPIIDLRDGSLTKVEALARLIGDDNELIAPHRFLPALGAECWRRTGVDQSRRFAPIWH